MKKNRNIIRIPICLQGMITGSLLVATLLTARTPVNAQAVSGIITDYNGFWKTSSAAKNAVQPDNHHNLLAFTYKGQQYSTGVNDDLLTTNGETFNAGQYQALPLQNVGTANANTKIGLGAMVDGVANGRGPFPSRNIGPYLSDGINGLDMGTCVANLPAGTMFMSVSNLRAERIGDSVPDILVTQIADPSSSYDSYEFTDVNGVRIGNSLNVVLNNIQTIGSWMADFYEASRDELAAGYTKTPRDIRLWAMDLSSFGLNASNIGDVAYFKINLSGTSDIAFVAYNTTTITVQEILDLNNVPERIAQTAPEERVGAYSVFPNPARAQVNFTHPKAEAHDRILVYNLNGVVVRQVVPAVHSSRTPVDVSSLSPGSFLAVYVGNAGRVTKRLVVQ